VNSGKFHSPHDVIKSESIFFGIFLRNGVEIAFLLHFLSWSNSLISKKRDTIQLPETVLAKKYCRRTKIINQKEQHNVRK
jgi:hypothetical protein